MCTMNLNNVNSCSGIGNNKQIEDIIDARKLNGEYNIALNSAKSVNSQNYTCRYAYSTPRGILEERFIVPDEMAMWNIEGDLNSDRDGNVINVGPTDSEITVVRVKRESSHLKQSENKWDMHDKAIPGDGTHLGESPSLVNLVTLVKSSKQYLNPSANAKENDEYLVPLSSWDPLDESHEIEVDSIESKNSNSSENDAEEQKETVMNTEEVEEEKIEFIKPPSIDSRRSLNLAARLISFFRKRFKKSQKLPSTRQ